MAKVNHFRYGKKTNGLGKSAAKPLNPLW